MTATPRRWFRWSLRTMFVVVTAVALSLFSAREYRERKRLEAELARERANGMRLEEQMRFQAAVDEFQRRVLAARPETAAPTMPPPDSAPH
jgi:hypothetical protein